MLGSMQIAHSNLYNNRNVNRESGNKKEQVAQGEEIPERSSNWQVGKEHERGKVSFGGLG